MKLFIDGKKVISCVIMTLTLLCVAAGSAQASGKCDSKKVEVVRGDKVVWSGATVDFFKKYPHGKIGRGNRPERDTVRLSVLIKDIDAQKMREVIVSACKDSSRQVAVADIIKNDIDLWLVGIRSGEIRMFEYKKSTDKLEQDFKRIIRVQFIQ